MAVYLVVAFHAGVGRLNGGFVGVDVFFVLSGYLVTTVLLRDVEEQGRVRLARFYARRVRGPLCLVRLLQVGPGLDDRRVGVDEALLGAGRSRRGGHPEGADRHGQGRAGRAEPEPGGLRQGRSG